MLSEIEKRCNYVYIIASKGIPYHTVGESIQIIFFVYLANQFGLANFLKFIAKTEHALCQCNVNKFKFEAPFILWGWNFFILGECFY